MLARVDFPATPDSPTSANPAPVSWTPWPIRHRKPENLRRYFKPSPQAMCDLTSLLGPRR